MVTAPRRVGQAELRAFLFDRLGLRGPFWSADEAAASLPGLGMVQIDSIRVTGLRNQELAWLARADAPPAAFYDLLYRQGMMLETHYPLFATRRDWLPPLWAGFADMPARWRAERQKFRPVMRRVLRHIRENGPATAADFAAERVPGGFNTVKATTKALEFLFTDRVLQIAGRTPNFHRAFDLTERVAPELVAWRRPTAAESRRFVVDSALAVLKIATADQIAQRAAVHHGQWRGQVLKPMRALVDRMLPEAARAVTVADLPGEPVYWYRAEDEIGWERAARAAASPSRIVPPLDNLLFSRKRFSALFGFDYKFEAYTPAADRRFYFALPLIQDDDLVGLVDARATAGRWELVGLELRRPVALDRLRAAIHRLAGFAGAKRVTATSGVDRAARRALTGPVRPMTAVAGIWPARIRRAMPLVIVAVFGAALWLLAHALATHRIDDILGYLAGLPRLKVAGAIVFTALSYTTLVGYDLSALHYVGRRLPLRDVALASFISYAFSNTIGFAAVTGGSVRYRIYSAAGLNGFEIAAVVVFCTATFGIGAMAISGLVLLIDPRLVGGMLHFEPSLVRALGSALLALLLAYLVFTALQPEQVRIRQWRLKLPSPRLTLVQILVASVDLAFAGAALWLLMPADLGLDFPRFLGIFVVAVTLGQLSHVPGGLGVFESVIVLLARAPASEVLGALLAYRAVYYLMPLGIAALLLALTELAERQHRLIRTVRLLGGTLNQVAPSILAAAAFIGGAVLLFAGAVPEGAPRLALLRAVVPEAVVELAHLAGSIAGVGLLLLSQALLRRLEMAYRWSLVLVGAGIVASLLKGFDYSETAVLLVVGIALYPSRALFYRHAPLLGDRLGPAWLTAIAITLAAAAWVGFLSYKNVNYSHALWWQFAFDANAPRFLRAALAVSVVGIVFLLALLFRPPPPMPGLPGPGELSEAARIVRRSPTAAANLALLGDKPLLFDVGRDGFLSYGVRGQSWVALGDPVGPPGSAAELVWSFRELSHRHDGNPVFFDVGADRLPLYLDLGLTLLKLGEEAWVPLPRFDIAAPGRQSLREAHRRTARDDATVELLAPAQGAAMIDELRRISDAWLADKKAREKGFSLGVFDPAYLAHFPIALLRLRGRLVAFANLLPAADGAEIAVDLMRHVTGVPGAALDYFMVEMLAWARDQGFARFNLGLAPLAGLEAKPLGPLWSRAGVFIFNRGGAFPDLRGLRQNKARYQPEWRPKYIAAPGGLALPRVLQDVAALISGREEEAG